MCGWVGGNGGREGRNGGRGGGRGGGARRKERGQKMSRKEEVSRGIELFFFVHFSDFGTGVFPRGSATLH